MPTHAGRHRSRANGASDRCLQTVLAGATHGSGVSRAWKVAWAAARSRRQAGTVRQAERGRAGARWQGMHAGGGGQAGRQASPRGTARRACAPAGGGGRAVGGGGWHAGRRRSIRLPMIGTASSSSSVDRDSLACVRCSPSRAPHGPACRARACCCALARRAGACSGASEGARRVQGRSRSSDVLVKGFASLKHESLLIVFDQKRGSY